MNAAMSSSLWLNEATPASPRRSTAIAASTGSAPVSCAMASRVLSSVPAGPEVMSSEAAPPRRRRLSAISGRMRASCRGSSSRFSIASRPPSCAQRGISAAERPVPDADQGY
jgi:hypothetical protein